MVPLLTTLPNELFQGVLSLLLLPDQAALGRTCKLLNQLLTPTIWSEIELHHRGTHEGINVEEEIDSLDWQDPKERLASALANEPGYPYNKLVLEPSWRKYSQVEFDPVQWAKRAKLRSAQDQTRHQRNSNINNGYSQNGRERMLLDVRKITSKTRWDFLAQLVQSLCMSAGVNDEVVELIASLSNLRSLELTGYPLEGGHPATAPDVYLPRLECLKLRGYFSGALVRKFCSNADHLRHLNLGLLATSTDDAAYEDTLLKNDDNWALVSDDAAERYQQNGAEAAALAPKSADTIDCQNDGKDDSDDANKVGEGPGDDDDDDEDNEDDDDDEDQEPWSLHGPIWLPRLLPQRFVTLTHLHLVKPYTGESAMSMAHDGYIDIPHRYEQVLNKEWVFLLQAVASTLKEVILEHRIPMRVGDTVGDGDPHPSPKFSSDDRTFTAWGRGRDGPDRGDEIFCRSVLRLLLEESNSFLQLAQLSFRGIQVKGLPVRRDSDEVPGKNGVPDNDELLTRAFPKCSIEIFEPAYPIHVYAGDVYQGWPEERQEASQDEGDGLLNDASFYNDYKKRFGPQWRIQS
jgi:hypothetical protein